MLIDSIASAGVKAGLPRALSQDIACQVVMGSAKLASSSNEHPAELIDSICSPGGTTIEGVLSLQKNGFEAVVAAAVDAAVEKDKRL